MKIIRAKILGFCAGVRRAVLAADKALGENTTGRVYTLGPLIHNPVALKKLEERNLKILNENQISQLHFDDTVIIRAHGVTPEIEEALENKKINVINATCPLVTKSQKTCAEFAKEGYIIFFAGDKNHGEVVGIEGYAKKAALQANKDLHFILIKDENELEKSITELKQTERLTSDSKIVLLSQTTFSIKMFESLQKKLKEYFPAARIVSSICPATHERQNALKELSSHVEGIIVIGGKNSANTNRLFKTASLLCSKSVLIENPDEIPEEFYKLNTVGITAGASTPDDTIAAVEERLMSLSW